MIGAESISKHMVGTYTQSVKKSKQVHNTCVWVSIHVHTRSKKSKQEGGNTHACTYKLIQRRSLTQYRLPRRMALCSSCSLALCISSITFGGTACVCTQAQFRNTCVPCVYALRWFCMDFYVQRAQNVDTMFDTMNFGKTLF